MNDFEYVSKNINPDLICPICQKVMVLPQSLKCHHSFCQNCIDVALSSSQFCPVCHKPSDTLDLEPADHTLSSLLDELEVRCLSRRQGCKWTGERQSLAKHMSECEYFSVPCGNQGCKEMTISRRDLETHLKECLHRLVSCDKCNESFSYSKLSSHAETCPKNVLDCRFCQEAFPRDQMSTHIIGSCPESSIPCTFIKYGCDWTGKRKELVQHSRACKISPFSTIILKQEEEHKQSMVENQRLKEEQQTLARTVSQLRADLESLASILPQIDRLTMENARLASDFLNLSAAFNASEARHVMEIQSLRQLVHSVSLQDRERPTRKPSTELSMKL